MLPKRLPLSLGGGGIDTKLVCQRLPIKHDPVYLAGAFEADETG